jgi:SAM-dependent methyltransferase
MSTSIAPTAREPSPAFDAEAVGYRENWNLRPIVRGWRGRVLAAVLEGRPARVLDLGAGSGADAAALAAAGCAVTAVEPSPGMRDTAATRGLPLLAGSVGALPDTVGADYDAVLLDFGVLNCLPSLEPLGADLRARLRVGGRVILVWMSPTCPVEALSRAMRLQRPRRGRPVARVAGHAVLVRWWRVADVRAALGAAFVVHRVEALGLLVPAPELGGRPGRRSAIEPWIARWPRIREWGDHTLLVAERVA